MKYLVCVVLVSCACQKAPSADRPKQSPPDSGTAAIDAAAIPASEEADAKPTTEGQMDTSEKVKKWAGPQYQVYEWQEGEVEGVEIYQAQTQHAYIGVVVLPGSDEPKKEKEGLKAVLDTGVSDPTLMAALSMHFLEVGGAPINPDEEDLSKFPKDHQALVKAPFVKGRVLEYWHRDKRGSQLIRGRLDLDTLELEKVTSWEVLSP